MKILLLNFIKYIEAIIIKKLPKIYQNEINKKITNNKKICYLNNKEQIPKKNIDDVLNEIFNGLGYSYNIPVIITTKNKIYNTSILSKTKNNIITLDNDIININNVIDIEIKK